jgi:hypothetical protein
LSESATLRTWKRFCGYPDAIACLGPVR